MIIVTIDVKEDGSIYVGGQTSSTDFPTLNAYQNQHEGGTFDAYLFALNSSGSNSFFNVSGRWIGRINKWSQPGYSGNALLPDIRAPWISPSTANITGSNFAGSDAFISKFDGSLGSLTYSSCLGGLFKDVGEDITVDSTGNVYLVGYTEGPDFPTQNGAMRSWCGNYSKKDGFVDKINPDTSDILFSSYLCGGNDDNASEITLDTSGNIIVAGTTQSDDFPYHHAIDNTLTTESDVFLTQLGPSGSYFLFSLHF